MDILSMAMAKAAKPKVLDFSQFACIMNGTTVSFNDVLLTLLNNSLTSGGTAQSMEIRDMDGALRKAASNCVGRSLIMRMTYQGAVIEMPVANGFLADGTATQFSGKLLMIMDGVGTVEATAILQFNLYSNDLLIGVKASFYE